MGSDNAYRAKKGIGRRDDVGGEEGNARARCSSFLGRSEQLRLARGLSDAWDGRVPIYLSISFVPERGHR